MNEILAILFSAVVHEIKALKKQIKAISVN
jgi:hypothetical protein